MNLDLILYLSPFFVSSTISAGIGLFSLRHRDIKGAWSYGIFALLQASMTLAFIFELTSSNLEAKIFWDNLQFIIVYLSPIIFLKFALDYTNKEIKNPNRLWVILTIVPILFTLLLFTDSFHKFIRPDLILVPGEPFDALFYEFTTTVWIVSIYCYGITLTAIWFLVTQFIQAQWIYRFQIGLVILGVLIPLVGTIITLLDLIPTLHRDITPFTLAVGNLVVAWALFRYQLFNLAPVARETVFINLTDFVIVIDSQSRIIDLNPAALKNLGKPATEIIGKPIREIFKSYSHLFDDLSRLTDLDTEISIENDENLSKFFSLKISALHDRHGRLVGRVVIIRDISERKLAEEAIRIHRDELEEIVEARTTGLLAANESLKQENAERQSIEKSLRKTQQQFQDMFDNSQAIIYAKSMDGKYIFANREWRERSGLGDQDFNNKTNIDLFPEYWQNIWDENEKLVIETGMVSMVEEIGLITGKTYLTTNFLLRDSDGTPYAICNSSIDITDRAHAEKELQQSVQRLETLRKIDHAIIATESPKSIAQIALDHLIKQIPCSYACILTYDPETNLSKFLAMRSENPAVSISQSAMMHQGVENDLQSGEIKIIDLPQNSSHLSPWEQYLLDQGFQSYIKVPLSFQQSMVGWVNLGSENSITLAQEQQEILKEVANQLAIAIQQGYLNKQIKLHADTLEQRIAERTAELKAANQHLQALSNVKDEFVSNVSHELRTPITSLKLYHDLLPMQPEKLDEYLATLRRETNRLETLIEELLTLSRLDQGRINSQLSKCDLNTTIKTYLSDRSLLAAKQGINLNFVPDEGLPIVEVDENLIGQVLSILLTNALNYTPPNSNVSVITQTQQLDGDFWAGFCVQDTGPGIQPDEIDQLFNRFFRGKVGRDSGVPGTGLGLSIAHEIITQHNGFLEVESEGRPGKGTSFKVWLPT